MARGILDSVIKRRGHAAAAANTSRSGVCEHLSGVCDVSRKLREKIGKNVELAIRHESGEGGGGGGGILKEDITFRRG